jgi:hypothetical protein
VQLDIFEHSHDIMLRNDVLAALQRFHAVDARSARQRLEQVFPEDTALEPSSALIEALERWSTAPFTSHESARSVVHALAERIQPAALHLLGDEAGSEWMLPLWRSVAQRAAALSYRAQDRELHAAALWLRAREWRAACDAVADIESWRRIPVPLGWMAQARLHLDGLDAVWPLIAELAWLAPARLGALWPVLDDPLLHRLRRRFDAEFEGRGDDTDIAWFPAWLLTANSGMARILGAAQPSDHGEPEQAMRLLVECIGLERQGRQHDLVASRRRLRALHSGLYDAYMRVR